MPSAECGLLWPSPQIVCYFFCYILLLGGNCWETGLYIREIFLSVVFIRRISVCMDGGIGWMDG